MKLSKQTIIIQIITLFIIILLRNGIKITHNNEIYLQIHGGIIRICFIRETLYELFGIIIPKIFKTIIKDIK